MTTTVRPSKTAAMEAMQAAQHVYVVKVRALPDPALQFPSERRYSALTVAGLAAGHALLGGVALLLGLLALSWDPSDPEGPEGYAWCGHLGAGLWLGAAALQAAACGVLAWRRWYEDRYIAWFFRSSLLAALVAGAGLVLTAAALVHLHEGVLALPEPYEPAAPGPAAADEGSGGGSSWLDLVDLADSNSSTISSGGVFSDLVRDQDHDLVAADSTRHEDLAARQVAPEDGLHALPEVSEWSVLRWVPVPLPPRASAQVRALVAVNVMVACFLELLWSLLGARLAWRGMQATDVDIAQPQGQGLTPAAPAQPRSTPDLERGAADGKVDVDTDQSANLSDGELKVSRDESGNLRKKKKQTKSVEDGASLQRRRRAPELPILALEQRTMNLEERVARLLGAEQTVGVGLQDMPQS